MCVCVLGGGGEGGMEMGVRGGRGELVDQL